MIVFFCYSFGEKRRHEGSIREAVVGTRSEVMSGQAMVVVVVGDPAEGLYDL